MEHRGTLKRSQRQSCSQSFEEELDSNLEGTVDTSNSGFILNSTPENSPRPLFSCHNSCSDSSSTPQSTSDEINICRKRRGKCSKPDGHPGAHDNKGTLKNPFYIYSPIIKQNQSRSLDKEISAKTQKLDELNESYERLIYLIERGAVPADVKTPTTFETITNRNSSVRFARKKNTKSVLRCIHGGIEGAIFGAWDFISTNISDNLLNDLIMQHKKGKFIEAKFNSLTKKYTFSDAAINQAIQVKYGLYLSRRKYQFHCRTMSSFYNPDKKTWVPRVAKIDGLQLKTRKSISDTKIQAFVSKLDIGDVFQVPGEVGVTRTVTQLVIMITDLHLRVPHLKKDIMWIGERENHFIFIFGDDGAPETKELTMSMATLTSLNFGERVTSREMQYILHGLSVGEKAAVMEDLWRQHTAEMEIMEGNKFTINNQIVTISFQPAADEAWQSWAANEVNQAFRYPSLYANVNSLNLNTIGQQIGTGEQFLWEPYNGDLREKHIKMIEDYKLELSSKDLTEGGKHKKLLEFMASNGIRALGKPRIGSYVNKLRPDPLHKENNGWQHFLFLCYLEAVQRDKFVDFKKVLEAPITGYKTSYVTGQQPTELLQKHKISDVTSAGCRSREFASPDLTDFMGHLIEKAEAKSTEEMVEGIGMPGVASALQDHYNKTETRHNKPSFRIIGPEAIQLAQYSYRIIDTLKTNNEAPEEKVKRIALQKISESLRDASVQGFSRFHVTENEIVQTEKCCTQYFNLNSLFFSQSVNLTVWSIGYAIPYGMKQFYKDHKLGLGAISMQPRESFNQGTKKALALTNRSNSVEAGKSKWSQYFQAEYMRKFYMPEHCPLPLSYNSHHTSRLPPHMILDDVCNCGRFMENDLCSFCDEFVDEVVKCGLQGTVTPEIEEILKPVMCPLCQKRYSDEQQLKNHHCTHMNLGTQESSGVASNVDTSICYTKDTKDMSVEELRNELFKLGKSTLGSKAILKKRLDRILDSMV